MLILIGSDRALRSTPKETQLVTEVLQSLKLRSGIEAEHQIQKKVPRRKGKRERKKEKNTITT